MGLGRLVVRMYSRIGRTVYVRWVSTLLILEERKRVKEARTPEILLVKEIYSSLALRISSTNLGPFTTTSQPSSVGTLNALSGYCVVRSPSVKLNLMCELE